jgi:DNA-binding ferritin-like protein (Dps family)
MRKFGLLKSIVENNLVNSYKKPEFKRVVREFKEFINDHKSVGKVYLDYGSILKTKGLSEDVATDFITLSIDNIKQTIKENKKEFEEFDSWVETLEESSDNEYELLDKIIYANSANDFVQLIESKKILLKSLTESVKIDEKQISETINIPLEKMFEVVAETFSKEYSNLSESQLFEIKSILKMSKEELSEGIERLKTEVVSKLDEQVGTDEETSKAILETKKRVIDTPVDSLSYYKLKKLSEGL